VYAALLLILGLDDDCKHSGKNMLTSIPHYMQDDGAFLYLSVDLALDNKALPNFWSAAMPWAVPSGR
jgi:hypothetical protein